jgi:hypothetical protein
MTIDIAEDSSPANRYQLARQEQVSERDKPRQRGSAPGEIRTPDLRFRSLALAEYLPQIRASDSS